MMNLKKSVFVVIILMGFLTQQTTAQTQHEAGLRFNDFETFSAIYKKQKDETSFMRYRINAGRLAFSEVGDNQRFSGNVEIAIGKENRKQLMDKLSFIYGIEPALGIAYNTQNGNSAFRISPSLGYVLGLQYEFFERLAVGLEVIPAINGTFQRANNADAINLGLDFQATGLTVAYRFER